MSAEKYIIDKIIKDAEEKARQDKSDAKKALFAELDAAKKEIKQEYTRMLSEAKDALSLSMQQSAALKELEDKKTTLLQKQNNLNHVFAEAKMQLISLKDKEYQDLIKKLILKHCQDQDKVIISKKDEKRLSAAFIQAVADAAKKSLTRVVSGNFEGGVVLSGKYYDTVLTFDNLFQTLRQTIEKEVADLLF